ncbi:MAG: hypothetical protein GY820_10120 [Gammaproteobacteria bacterium]|nr:hypothetical protein [Gammaproteobacteria bacterium]
MFIESINWVDVGLEGTKAISMLVMLVIVRNSGARYPQIAKGPWKFIGIGFTLMFLGFLCDTSDEIINYEANDAVAVAQSMFEELTLICGLVLATIGFSGWFDFVGRFLGLKKS